MTFQTAYEKALTANSTVWGGWTLVQLIPSGLLEPAVKFRLTLYGATTNPTVVNEMYLGKRGLGDLFDFAGTPVQVKVGGLGSFTIPQSGSVVTDEIEFTYDALSDLLIATSFSGTSDLRVSLNSGSGTSYYFKNLSGDADTVDKSGYDAASANPNSLGLIGKIEIEPPEVEEPPPPPEYTPFMYLRDDTYVAAWPIELVSEIRPLIDYVNYIDRAPLWRRFAHVLVPDVQPGDVIDVKCMLEATNPNSYPVEWVYGLVLTPSSSGTAGCENMPSVSSTYEPSGGRLMSRMPGHNVTGFSAQHHGIFPYSVSYIVPEGIEGNMYVAAIGYASGSSLSGPNDALKIEPYCGDLSANIRRKAPIEE